MLKKIRTERYLKGPVFVLFWFGFNSGTIAIGEKRLQYRTGSIPNIAREDL